MVQEAQRPTRMTLGLLATARAKLENLCPFGRRVKNPSASCRAGQEAKGRSGDERICPRWIRLAGGVKRGPLAAGETRLSAQPGKPGVIGEKSSHSRRASITLFSESRTDQQNESWLLVPPVGVVRWFSPFVQ